MKAAWQYKQEWEEINFLRLTVCTRKIAHYFCFGAKTINQVASFLLFIAYCALKIVLACCYLLVATKTSLRNTKEEEWIFRQIK